MGRLATLVTVLVVATMPALAQLRGHGGPVRALAVSPDGLVAISGSFDQSAILWTIDRAAALSVLRLHAGAVNAVAAAPGGVFVTAGEDGRIALWQAGAAQPDRVFTEHSGPVAALALSPDGLHLASASWDGTVRVRPLAGGEARLLEGHSGNVNAVAFLPDGHVVSAGYDLTLRVWPLEPSDAPLIVTLPSPLNAVATTHDGEIAAAGADGIVRMLRRDGSVRAEVELPRGPVIALAASPDGTRLAAATIAGAVAVIDRAEAKILFHLVGPGLPVWSLAWRPDGREILTGGSDRLVRRWDARSGEPIGPISLERPADMLAGFTGSRGAELFQACAACHTLTPDGGNRAGPTLHGVIGRRIATASGYAFSDALKKLDIVWTKETIGRLFEIGPSRYTPGTKMPEQTVPNEGDRAALVDFIASASRAR
jgi:cytochrome c